MDHQVEDQVINKVLRLINNRSQATRNICFANSVVQLMAMSGYASLLKTQFPQYIEGKPLGSFKGCRALHDLYMEESNRERSAALLRKLVAQQSGKDFLSNGHQQDSEEFLRATITMINIELNGWDTFNIINKEHFGKERIKRKFLDNASGVCFKCGQYPSYSEQEFLCVKLNVPSSSLPVDLSALIDNKFSEETQIVAMKCSECCNTKTLLLAQKSPVLRQAFVVDLQ